MATIMFVGATIRPQAQPSAIVVTQLDHVYNRVTRKKQEFFTLRGLEMVPAHTNYPDIAIRLKQIVDNLHTQAAQYKARVVLYVDVTGLGSPIIDLIRAKVDPMITCYMSANDKRTEHDDRVIIGKAWMIAKMQTLLQDGRVKLPETELTKIIINDLLTWDLDPAPTDNELTGSFTVGTQDQLLTAFGLACQGLPEKEQAGEEYLEYLRNRVMFRPGLHKASADWLKEWHGKSPIRTVDPITGQPTP